MIWGYSCRSTWCKSSAAISSATRTRATRERHSPSQSLWVLVRETRLAVSLASFICFIWPPPHLLLISCSSPPLLLLISSSSPPCPSNCVPIHLLHLFDRLYLLDIASSFISTCFTSFLFFMLHSSSPSYRIHLPHRYPPTPCSSFSSLVCIPSCISSPSTLPTAAPPSYYFLPSPPLATIPLCSTSSPCYRLVLPPYLGFASCHHHIK